MQSLLPLAVTAAIAVSSAPAAAQVAPSDGTVPIYDITPQPVPTPVPVPTSTPTSAPTSRPVIAPTVRATATPVPRATPTPRATPDPVKTPVPTLRANPEPVPSPVSTADPAPVPDPVEQFGTLEAAPTPAIVDTPPTGAEQATPADPASDIPGWLWFVAGLAVAGLIALVLGRRRRSDSTGGVSEPADVPVAATIPPMPVAVPVPPVPSSPPPAPVAPAPLPPRALEFQLAPLRVGVQGEQALLDFDLSVGNATDIPCEEVRIATLLLTANARQDEQIAAFLADDSAAALDPFPVAAGERRRLEATMSLPRDALTIVTANERPFFVPVMAIDARYRWADGRESRTSAAFVVGPALPNGKLSPVFVDRGDRMVDGLEARLHGEVRRS